MAFRHGNIAHGQGEFRHGDIAYAAFGAAFLGVAALAAAEALPGTLTVDDVANVQATGVEAVASAEAFTGTLVAAESIGALLEGAQSTAGAEASIGTLVVDLDVQLQGSETVGGAESAGGTLAAEADGWLFVVLEDPLAESGYRLKSIPDLEAGDKVWYGNISGELAAGVDVVVESDGSITLSEAALEALPVTFDAFVDDGERGPTAGQTLAEQADCPFAGVESVADGQSQPGTLLAAAEFVVVGVAADAEALAEPGTFTLGNQVHQTLSGESSEAGAEAAAGVFLADVRLDAILSGTEAEASAASAIGDPAFAVAFAGTEAESETVASPGVASTGQSINVVLDGSEALAVSEASAGLLASTQGAAFSGVPATASADGFSGSMMVTLLLRGRESESRPTSRPGFVSYGASHAGRDSRVFIVAREADIYRVQ